MSKFTYLESPMTIRGKVYRNRLIAAPTLFAHSVFFCRRLLKMYTAWWRTGQRAGLPPYPQVSFRLTMKREPHCLWNGPLTWTTMTGMTLKR